MQNDEKRPRKDAWRVSYRVIRSLVTTGDIPPELAEQVLKSIKVRGVFRASKAVKEVLGDRMER